MARFISASDRDRYYADAQRRGYKKGTRQTGRRLPPTNKTWPGMGQGGQETRVFDAGQRPGWPPTTPGKRYQPQISTAGNFGPMGQMGQTGDAGPAGRPQPDPGQGLDMPGQRTSQRSPRTTIRNGGGGGGWPPGGGGGEVIPLPPTDKDVNWKTYPHHGKPWDNDQIRSWWLADQIAKLTAEHAAKYGEPTRMQEYQRMGDVARGLMTRGPTGAGAAVTEGLGLVDEKMGRTHRFDPSGAAVEGYQNVRTSVASVREGQKRDRQLQAAGIYGDMARMRGRWQSDRMKDEVYGGSELPMRRYGGGGGGGGGGGYGGGGRGGYTGRRSTGSTGGRSSVAARFSEGLDYRRDERRLKRKDQLKREGIKRDKERARLDRGKLEREERARRKRNRQEKERLERYANYKRGRKKGKTSLGPDEYVKLDPAKGDKRFTKKKRQREPRKMGSPSASSPPSAQQQKTRTGGRPVFPPDARLRKKNRQKLIKQRKKQIAEEKSFMKRNIGSTLGAFLGLKPKNGKRTKAILERGKKREKQKKWWKKWWR